MLVLLLVAEDIYLVSINENSREILSLKIVPKYFPSLVLGVRLVLAKL